MTDKKVRRDELIYWYRSGGQGDVARGLMLSPDRPVHLTRQARKDRIQNVLCHDSAVTQYITQAMDHTVMELGRLLRHLPA